MLQKQKLLNLYFSTSFFKLLLQRLSLVFSYTFFQGLGSTVNQFFSLFQAQTSQVFHQFHYSQLGATSSLQDNVERRLLLRSLFGSTTTATGNYYGSSSSRLDAILVFQDACQFVYFFHRQVYKLLSECFQICHFCRLLKKCVVKNLLLKSKKRNGA